MHIRPVTKASVIAINCSSTSLYSVIIRGDATTGLLSVNAWGRSYLESLRSTGISLYYVNVIVPNHGNSVLFVTHCQLLKMPQTTVQDAFQILTFNYTNNLTILFSSVKFSSTDSIITEPRFATKFSVIFDQCHFTSRSHSFAIGKFVGITFPTNDETPPGYKYHIQFINCEFTDNYHTTVIEMYVNNTVHSNCQVSIINCTFQQNHYSSIINAKSVSEASYLWTTVAKLTIESTEIKDMVCLYYKSVIDLENIHLEIKDYLTISNVTSKNEYHCESILCGGESMVLVHGHFNILHNKTMTNLVYFRDAYIQLVENSVINIIDNIVEHNIVNFKRQISVTIYPLCFFQFYSTQGNKLWSDGKANYSVMLINNEFTKIFSKAVKLLQCGWMDDAVSFVAPYVANSNLIKFINASGNYSYTFTERNQTTLFLYKCNKL